MKALRCILFFTILAACSTRGPSPSSSPLSAPVAISIVGLNDLHGTIEAREVILDRGKTSAQVGGLEMMAGYFDAVRASNPGGVLFVDSGDIYQGSLLSNWFQGRSIVKAYAALGIDASTFGNHEFDFGDRKGKPVGEAADARGALKVLLGEATFRLISTNVREGDALLPHSVPSAIFERAGVKIGVLGVTTVTTPLQAAPRNLVGLQFRDLADTIRAEGSRLRAQGAQVLVLLAHAGGKCDLTLPPEKGDEACRATPTDEITALLEALPPEFIDVVMAGHTHFAQRHFIRGVPVVQTTGFGASFSQVQLYVDPRAPASAPRATRIAKIEISSPTFFCHSHFARYASCDPDDPAATDVGAPIPPNYRGHPIVPRRELASVLAPFVGEVAALQQKPLFKLSAALSHDRSKESPTANCVADLTFRAAFGDPTPPRSVFLSHSGGIRSGLPGRQITYGDWYRVLPFDNGLVRADLTGEELVRYATGLSNSPKSIAVISDPWKIQLAKAMVFPRSRALVPPGGAPLDGAAVYRVVTDEFNTLQGGAFDALFAPPRARGALHDLSDNFRDFLAASFAKGGRNETLPASCQGPRADRTEFVE